MYLNLDPLSLSKERKKEREVQIINEVQMGVRATGACQSSGRGPERLMIIFHLL